MRQKNPDLMAAIKSYAEQYYRENRRPPAQRVIAAACGISPSCAHKYLVEMGRRGLIEYNGKVVGSAQIDKCAEDYISAPILGYIRCGTPREEEEAAEEYVSLPASITGKGDFFLLHAEGTSMVDAGIRPGDLLVVRKQPVAAKGEIVVALIDEAENTLKRFCGYNAEGSAILRYENQEEYPGETILVKDLRIQGVVKQCIHSFS